MQSRKRCPAFKQRMNLPLTTPCAAWGILDVISAFIAAHAAGTAATAVGAATAVVAFFTPDIAAVSAVIVVAVLWVSVVSFPTVSNGPLSSIRKPQSHGSTRRHG